MGLVSPELSGDLLTLVCIRTDNLSSVWLISYLCDAAYIHFYQTLDRFAEIDQAQWQIWARVLDITFLSRSTLPPPVPASVGKAFDENLTFSWIDRTENL